MIKNYPKGVKVVLSPNFSTLEFDCHCDQCRTTDIDEELITKLQALRLLIGSSITITSGFRCAHKQEMLRLQGYETAKGKSHHEVGQAADLSNGVMTGTELADHAQAAGFNSIGIGKHWIHVDLRPEHRRWYYKS